MNDKEKLVKALAHLKKFIDGDCVVDEEILADFPELRQTEDEKIVYALRQLVHKASGSYLFETTGIKKDAFLAYLERQKEQSLRPSWKPTQEQMDALRETVWVSEKQKILESLYNDLLKLK